MGFVDDNQSIGFDFLDFIDDLEKEAIFAEPWGFAEFNDDRAKKGVRANGGKGEIEVLAAVLWKRVDEAAQEGGFADAGLAQDESDLALFVKEGKAGEGLRETSIL
jgi:hypothetical protein